MPQVHDWSYIAFGLVLIGTGLAAYITYGVLSHFQVRREEHQLNRDFAQGMRGAHPDPRNGATYDWTPDSLAYLHDGYTGAPTTPFRAAPPAPDAGYGFGYPVPASTVSGPMPVMPLRPQPPMTVDPYDTDAFIAQMKARTAHLLPEPEPVPAVPADDADKFIAWMEARTTHALRQLGVTS